MPPPASGNFAAVLRRVTGPAADRPFLIEPGGAGLTYGQADDLAARLAAVLTSSGAGPGDRVLVQVDKSPTAVALYLACLHAGMVHVPLNPAFTDDEVGFFIADADPAVVVTDPARVDRMAPLTHSRALLTLSAEGAGTLTADMATTDPIAIVDRDDHDLAALLYTSGTTGRPKGAALSHASLRHNAEALHQIWHFRATDHLVHALPIFHVHGLFVALHCAMLSAIPVTFLPRFDVDAVIEALPSATVMMGVPTQYSRLLADDRFTAELTDSMRLFTSGSAPLPDAVFESFIARTGQRICERYGMSEAGIITSNPYDGDRLAGTVGHPLPGVELRVVDTDGRVVTAGTVEIKGPHLFSGYWGLPSTTAAAHRDDGFFVTDDVGRLDASGRLTLEGRAGDMIISGGENIYPKEIELILDSVPCIAESAVIGLPHPEFGEGVTAVVVAASLDTDAVEAALGASLARFKHPKQILTVDELPRNAMGKVQKNRLREDLAGLYANPPA